MQTKLSFQQKETEIVIHFFSLMGMAVCRGVQKEKNIKNI